MFYVYILISEKDNRTYIGQTNNLKNRLQRHNQGLVRSTRSPVPFRLLAYKECENRKDAM